MHNQATQETSILNLLPDDETISRYLKEMFQRHDSNLAGFEIASRAPGFSSTFEAEIITCRFSNAEDIVIRCKYLRGHENNQEGGHRGGVEYEAMIYEQRLAGLDLPLVKYYGHFYVGETNMFCLALEYKDGCIRIDKSPEYETLSQSAVWIAKFHSTYENINPAREKIYDRSYYELWAENTRSRGEIIREEYPWIFKPCEYFLEQLDQLLRFPTTLIHGEYYPHNILLKDNIVYPIDWESAAVAFAEIDLAGLVEGWDDENAEKAIQSYMNVRWPVISKDEETEFRFRLKLAKLYLHLRWIGTHADFAFWKDKPTRFKKFYKRLGHLHQFSKDLQLV